MSIIKMMRKHFLGKRGVVVNVDTKEKDRKLNLQEIVIIRGNTKIGATIRAYLKMS